MPQAPSYKNIARYAAHRAEKRDAPTLPPPPDVADHILTRVRSRRALAAMLLAEAAELERAATAYKERSQ